MKRVKKMTPETRWAVLFLHSLGWTPSWISSGSQGWRDACKEMREAKISCPPFKYRIARVEIREVTK